LGLKVEGLQQRVDGLGLSFQGSDCRVQGKLWDSKVWVKDVEISVYGARCRVSGFRVQGLGL
jgi:hypothetical protein